MLRTAANRKLTLYGFLGAGLLAAVSFGVVACQQGDPLDELPECAPPANAVSSELLAYLSKARSAHLQADIAVMDDESGEAIAALDALVDGPLPAGEPSPEVREVLADTLARTAELRSGAGDYDEARSDIERGLKLAPERTHYRGRLLEVLGAVESRLQKQLLAEGDSRGADAAKQRALKALHEAIDIQEEVIQKTLSEEPDVPLHK